jgi:RNA polymerase sigma-70 factor (ECF subfamily)
MSKRSLELRARQAAKASGAIVRLPRQTLDETALLLGVIEREPAAVAELFDRYGDLVRRILIRTLGSARDVDDLMQETFMVILRRAPTLKKTQALRSFIVSVAMRTSKNELRYRRVRRWVGLDEAPGVPITKPHDPVTAERVRALYRALDNLDLTSRLLFVLRHVEGLELAELAQAQACSLATLKRRLARAERRFEAIAGRDPALSELLRRGD